MTESGFDDQRLAPGARTVLRGLTESLQQEVVRQALPRARLIEIPGAGHMCPLTHAEAVNEAVAAHLASGA